jgi:hypothetical protein
MTAPDLDDFRLAAALGPWVWVEAAEDAVQGGAAPQAERLADVGALFVTALRERYGVAASGVAERQLDLHEGWHQPLRSATVSEALDCARSAQALLAARSFMLHFEYSAQLLGREFVRVCAELGLDAHALPPERREALDQAMQPVFADVEPPTRSQVEAVCRRLLAEAPH